MKEQGHKPKRGRPAGTPGASDGKRAVRRQKIAAAVLAGKPIAQVAREEGISRTWASREANSRTTKVVMATMIDERADRVRALLDKALTAVDQAFRAKDGTKRDHRVRLIAAKRVIEMATAGRTVDSSATDERTISYEQLEELYRSRTA